MRSFRRTALLAGACCALLYAVGCQPDRPPVQLDDPDLAAFVRLMMPKKIEIQRYLTKPISFAGDGNADGIEVLLAATDAFGDPVKVVGEFQFELHRLRMASGDRFGQRVALWKLQINSDDSFTEYWDRLARLYLFPLQLEQGPLSPGRYILTVRLRSPTGETLFDEYQFQHEGGTVPAASPRY